VQTLPIRRSPAHHFFEERAARWKQIGDALFAVHFGEAAKEAEAARDLALCDLSGLVKLGVRGPRAESWLREQNLDVPAALYETCALPDGGILARVGGDQFLLESGISGEAAAAALAHLPADVYPVERQEATFLLVGRRGREVLAQTCGTDFSEMPPRRLIYTRVAGVSAGILPEAINGHIAYRMWVDPSFAADLWEALATIVEELGGKIIGIGWLFPALKN
jgi:sarcosine oxidase subunit gamma